MLRLAIAPALPLPESFITASGRRTCKASGLRLQFQVSDLVFRGLRPAPKSKNQQFGFWRCVSDLVRAGCFGFEHPRFSKKRGLNNQDRVLAVSGEIPPQLYKL